MSKTMSKLKPCPFCGGEEVELDTVTYGIWSAFCRGCCVDFNFKTTNRREAVREWNTRASGWRKCSEEMPEIDEPVLFHGSVEWELHLVGEGSWNGQVFSTVDGEKVKAIHWQPLPEPPEGE